MQKLADNFSPEKQIQAAVFGANMQILNPLDDSNEQLISEGMTKLCDSFMLSAKLIVLEGIRLSSYTDCEV
jgi:hypothetical protein